MSNPLNCNWLTIKLVLVVIAPTNSFHRPYFTGDHSSYIINTEELTEDKYLMTNNNKWGFCISFLPHSTSGGMLLYAEAADESFLLISLHLGKARVAVRNTRSNGEVWTCEGLTTPVENKWNSVCVWGFCEMKLNSSMRRYQCDSKTMILEVEGNMCSFTTVNTVTIPPIVSHMFVGGIPDGKRAVAQKYVHSNVLADEDFDSLQGAIERLDFTYNSDDEIYLINSREQLKMKTRIAYAGNVSEWSQTTCDTNVCNTDELCFVGRPGSPKCVTCHGACDDGSICAQLSSSPWCVCVEADSCVLYATVSCNDSYCNDRGVCFVTNATLNECLCREPWRGSLCTRCGAVECVNATDCVDHGTGPECVCTPGFSGAACGQNIDDCSNAPCNNGTCHDHVLNYTCECHVGYEGEACEIDIDDCASQPCVNGSCRDLVDDYLCECSSGFTGLACDVELDECWSHPCVNGTCADAIGAFFCSCPDGFTGNTCDLDIDDCESEPCVEGVCRDTVDGYTCLCNSTGYTGVHCEVSIDECASQPCLNGSCQDKLDHYHCNCGFAFTGYQCETELYACVSQPCEAGTCDDVAGGYTCSFESYSNENPGAYSTEVLNVVGNQSHACAAGYTGELCIVELNECVSQPCMNGFCEDAVDGFICHCMAGKTGVLCQSDVHVNGCADHPCTQNLQFKAVSVTHEALADDAKTGVTVPAPSIIGKCVISPLLGYAWETNFTITCEDWVSEGMSDLDYFFHYKNFNQTLYRNVTTSNSSVSLQIQIPHGEPPFHIMVVHVNIVGDKSRHYSVQLNTTVLQKNVVADMTGVISDLKSEDLKQNATANSGSDSDISTEASFNLGSKATGINETWNRFNRTITGNVLVSEQEMAILLGNNSKVMEVIESMGQAETVSSATENMNLINNILQQTESVSWEVLEAAVAKVLSLFNTIATNLSDMNYEEKESTARAVFGTSCAVYTSTKEEFATSTNASQKELLAKLNADMLSNMNEVFLVSFMNSLKLNEPEMTINTPGFKTIFGKIDLQKLKTINMTSIVGKVAFPKSLFNSFGNGGNSCISFQSVFFSQSPFWSMHSEIDPEQKVVQFNADDCGAAQVHRKKRVVTKLIKALSKNFVVDIAKPDLRDKFEHTDVKLKEINQIVYYSVKAQYLKNVHISVEPISISKISIFVGFDFRATEASFSEQFMAFRNKIKHYENATVSDNSFFIQTQDLKDLSVDEIYIGLQQHCTEVRASDCNLTMSFRYFIGYFQCSGWDNELNKWKDYNKCNLMRHSDSINYVSLQPRSFGSITSSFLVAPNTLNLQRITSNFEEKFLMSYPIWVAFIMSLITYLVIMLLLWKQDLKDHIAWSIIELPDNEEYCTYLYELHIHTDRRKKTGATGIIYVDFTGSLGNVGRRRLSDKNGNAVNFYNGSEVGFLISTERGIGDIKKVEISFPENSTKDIEWLLGLVVVIDIQTMKCYPFFYRQWITPENFKNMTTVQDCKEARNSYTVSPVVFPESECHAIMSTTESNAVNSTTESNGVMPKKESDVSTPKTESQIVMSEAEAKLPMLKIASDAVMPPTESHVVTSKAESSVITAKPDSYEATLNTGSQGVIPRQCEFLYFLTLTETVGHSTYSELFKRNIKNAFLNNHRWLAPFFIQVKSTRTRVQLWTVCIFAVTGYMLGTALWYDTSLNLRPKSTVEVGTLGITIEDVVAVIYIVILVSVPTAILSFMYAKTKMSEKMADQRIISYVLMDDIKEQRIFPYFMTHILNFLVFVFVVTTVVVCCMFSLQWGPDLHKNWLISFLVNVVADMIFLDPVTMVPLIIFNTVYRAYDSDLVMYQRMLKKQNQD